VALRRRQTVGSRDTGDWLTNLMQRWKVV
jgi:hypothetical protein